MKILCNVAEVDPEHGVTLCMERKNRWVVVCFVELSLPYWYMTNDWEPGQKGGFPCAPHVGTGLARTWEGDGETQKPAKVVTTVNMGAWTCSVFVPWCWTSVNIWTWTGSWYFGVFYDSNSTVHVAVVHCKFECAARQVGKFISHLTDGEGLRLMLPTGLLTWSVWLQSWGPRIQSLPSAHSNSTWGGKCLIIWVY